MENDIKCGKCGYEWPYKGKLGYTQCPACRKMNKTPRLKEILK